MPSAITVLAVVQLIHLLPFRLSMVAGIQGRRTRGTGGQSPPKFEVGDGPCIRLPNILRSSVVGCARKYEQSKKGVFLVRKWSYTTFNIVKIYGKSGKRKGKSEKPCR